VGRQRDGRRNFAGFGKTFDQINVRAFDKNDAGSKSGEKFFPESAVTEQGLVPLFQKAGSVLQCRFVACDLDMNIPSKTKNFVVYNVRYQLGMNKSCQLVILDHDFSLCSKIDRYYAFLINIIMQNGLVNQVFY